MPDESTSTLQPVPGLRLTGLASCAGCAAKMGIGTLHDVLAPLKGIFDKNANENLLVGLDGEDSSRQFVALEALNSHGFPTRCRFRCAHRISPSVSAPREGRTITLQGGGVKLIADERRVRAVWRCCAMAKAQPGKINRASAGAARHVGPGDRRRYRCDSW